MQLEIKQIVGILLLIVGINSCTAPQSKTSQVEKIKGDWISDYFIDDNRKRILSFSFENNLCSYLLPYHEYSHYQISDDTLFIKERIIKRGNNTIGGKKIYQFLIVSLSETKLQLKPLTLETKALFKEYKKEKFDTIFLKKIIQKNELNFERIGFYSTACLGRCPSMYLEIDSVGNILFNGKRYTEKEGLYFGKISEIDLKIISDKVKSIQLDSLKEFYFADWTDDQTCGIKIKIGSKFYESKAYGFDKEPIELRILFHKLIEIYKYTEMKKNTLANKKFVFNNFERKSNPILSQ